MFAILDLLCSRFYRALFIISDPVQLRDLRNVETSIELSPKEEI